MDIGKIVFTALAGMLLLGLAFMAMQALPKPPVAIFAYGSNLAKSAMNARAGGFLNATAARLPGFSLAFAVQDSRPAEFGVATPVWNGSASVDGALYYLTPGQLSALDKQSDAPDFYKRAKVKVELPDGSIADAQAYFLAGNVHDQAPSRPYYLAVQAGMKEWGYDASSLDGAVADAAGPN
ncbi:MAG: gamma-glutamylcyclotransferase family protein [Candidatus Micrarchaeia archaeon]|jgi:gamma-glutamylcyclotransferase (GGCT)/AIG2-like uncharacterized protein YtfP